MHPQNLIELNAKLTGDIHLEIKTNFLVDAYTCTGNLGNARREGSG